MGLKLSLFKLKCSLSVLNHGLTALVRPMITLRLELKKVEFMNSETQSSNSNSQSGRPRRSNSKRRRSSSKRSGATKSTGPQGGNPTAGAKKKSSSNRRRRSGRGKSGPKLTGFDLVASNYNKILSDHLEARKRYFELYYRAQPQQRDKLERLFFESLDKLYNFENSVEEQYQEQFREMVDGLKPDLIYSEKRELAPEGVLEVASDEDIEDPHLLESQKSADFATDTEESTGTLEDYKAYKGIAE